MELATKLIELEKRTSQHRELLLTEEAAKTALVMPFLQALGYDVFNPAEVIPEFTADVGIKKGEKVDYALCIDGKVSILVECKPSNVDLDLKHASQLYRYFSTTAARVAVLTNGVVYQFYSDIEQPNKMDDKPFYVFSMDTLRRTDPSVLERFSRQTFDIDAIVAEAGRLKLESQMRIELEKEFAQPSDNRKSLARLHFNSPTTRYVGTFVGKAETRHPISAMTDIYKLEDAIVARIVELAGEK